MPQTQEEHLIALEDENEDSESEQGVSPGPDVEVTKINYKQNVSSSLKYIIIKSIN